MAIKITKSGNVHLSGRDYHELRVSTWEDQGKRCAECGERAALWQLDLHHKHGRGAGKRNDVAREVEMVHHWGCHQKYEAGVRKRPGRKPESESWD